MDGIALGRRGRHQGIGGNPRGDVAERVDRAGQYRPRHRHAGRRAEQEEAAHSDGRAMGDAQGNGAAHRVAGQDDTREILPANETLDNVRILVNRPPARRGRDAMARQIEGNTMNAR